MQQLSFILIAFMMLTVAQSAPAATSNSVKLPTDKESLKTIIDFLAKLPSPQRAAIVQELLASQLSQMEKEVVMQNSDGDFAGVQDEEQAQEQIFGMLASALIPYLLSKGK